MRTLATALHVAAALTLLAACDGEPEPETLVGAGGCRLLTEETIPGTWGWERALAVEDDGTVHVAASMQHATRAIDGTWSTHEESFGSPYFVSPRLAPGPGGVVVAHVADGLRVAREGAAGWEEIFLRPQVQCSGAPYIEHMDVAPDGRILLQGSEGPLLFGADAALQELERQGRMALDVEGTMSLSQSSPLTVTDRRGTHALDDASPTVRDIRASMRGEAAVIVEHDEPARLVAHLRDAAGVWAAEPVELAAWTDDECPDDPASGDRCTGTRTQVESATVHGGERLAASVVLRISDFDITWKCWPTVGVDSCYMGWEGSHVDHHVVLVGDLSVDAGGLTVLPVSEPGEDDPAPAVTRDAQGDHHVLVGDRYLRFGCGG